MNHWKILPIAAATITLTLFTGAAFTSKTSEQKINSASKIAKNTTKESLPEKPVENLPMPDSVHHKVPFTAQAPFGNWKDKRQATGCEEASVVMAMHWANVTDNQNKPLDPKEALKEITAISDYELKTYGYFEDTSAKDTLEKIIKSYFKYTNATLIYDIDTDDIKKELAKDRLVIVPVQAPLLKNPYYIPPGPPYHMILIIGYDDKTQEFITNDPGTKYGKDFRYSYKTMATALNDYKSGKGKSALQNRTAMIVVSKPASE